MQNINYLEIKLDNKVGETIFELWKNCANLDIVFRKFAQFREYTITHLSDSIGCSSSLDPHNFIGPRG